MFCDNRPVEKSFRGGAARFAAFSLLAAAIAYFPISATAQQQPGQKIFPSAVAASKALVAAIQSDDQSALKSILGSDGKDLLSSGDAVQDKNDRDQFTQKYNEMHRLVNEPDGETTLYIGAENWPMPIPLIHGASGWYFDTSAGKQEILYRRIGMNELAVIQTCHELADAEKEYDAKPHDGAADHQYAQKFLSDPGKHNGLYWQTSSGETESPIGPLVASAAAEGYTPTAGETSRPFQGYYFRILTGQGAHAPGGAKSYIVNGQMTGGFAILAYPAEYRSSGVKTFLVDQSGVVLEKDLGPRSAAIAKSMTMYNPDATWQKANSGTEESAAAH